MFEGTLSPNARQLLTQLGQEPLAQPSYLAGGSALALHLGHRTSIDLDFFTSESNYQSEPLVQRLRTIGELVVQQQSETTLVGSLNGVRLSFFFYPYPALGEFIELDEVQIASLLDIALMKLIAISQRGKKRDFVDLYFICQHGYSLDDLLTRLVDKYPKVSIYHLLRSLVYFGDAEGDPPPHMLVPYDWSQIKHFFQQEGERLMKKLYQG
jgi:predicted nucleotidyltransferase component of viral defense system